MSAFSPPTSRLERNSQGILAPHPQIYPSIQSWKDKLDELIKAAAIKILQESHLVVERVHLPKESLDHASAEKLRMSFCLAEFFFWKQYAPPVQAAFCGHQIRYLSPPSQINIVELFTLILLHNEEVGEQLPLLAESISTIFKTLMKSQPTFFASRDLYKRDALEGAAVCKLIINDSLYRGQPDRSIAFVSCLTYIHLKIGSAEYLARNLIHYHQFDPVQITQIEDTLLRDFLYYYLAKKMKDLGHDKPAEQYTLQILNPDLLVELI